MLNDFWGILILLTIVLNCILGYKSWTRRKENAAAVWLVLLCLSDGLWSMCHTLFYLIPDLKVALFFRAIHFIFVMSSSCLIFIFVCHTLQYMYFKRNTLMLILSLPLINGLMVLTNSYHHLVRKQIHLISGEEIRYVSSVYGPWFIVHAMISYGALLFAVWVIFKQLIRINKKYKGQVGLMILCLLMVSVFNMNNVFKFIEIHMDPSPFFTSLLLLSFYYSLFNSHSLSVLFISRNFIFENYNSFLMVLDKKGHMIDYNKKCTDLAEKMAIKNLCGMKAEGFIQKWLKENQGQFFKEDQTIFTVYENQLETHYQIHITEMYERGGRSIGSYMEIKNITPIMSLIHMLQDSAYHDHLTGLPNRRYFAIKTEELDKASFYPLAVVVGDVNNLKVVNDLFGHTKGDQLLKQIAEILVECCPPQGLLARVGGDEFLGLFPNTNQTQTEEFIAAVERRCALLPQAEFPGADIALGYRLKTHAGQDIQTLSQEADVEMYITKRNRRKSKTHQ